MRVMERVSVRSVLCAGPFHLNGCPLRRVNQIYCIATKTKLDIGDVKVSVLCFSETQLTLWPL